MNGASPLDDLVVTWRRRRRARGWLIAVTIGCTGGALMALTSLPGGLLFATAGTLLLAVARRHTWRISRTDIVRHLDRTYAELEESAGLWLIDESQETLPQRWQRKRLEQAWSALVERDGAVGEPSGRLIRFPALAATLATAAFLLVAARPLEPRQPEIAPLTESGLTIAAAATAPGAPIRAVDLEIVPPAYTGRPTRTLAGLDAEAEEGAEIRWRIEADPALSEVKLATADVAGGPSVERVGVGRFVAKTRLDSTLVYRLEGVRADGTRWVAPDFHAIKARPDRPPRIGFESPTVTRTTFSPETPTVTVRLAALDDYGLASVELVATVAKGSGEAVKFHDERIPLSEEAATDPTGTRRWSATLAADQLGLEAGDEVYFHAIATDRREPEPNRVRTETRFALLPGPEATESEPGIAVAGVSLIPEYFRSQRQLIIDTQRLIAARPILLPEVFARHSDAIGVDQKLLRLRYGQFLGEEFEPETTDAPVAGVEVDEHGHAKPAGVNLPGGGAVAMEAERPSIRPQVVDAIQAQFMHNHDKPEAATFYGETVKASLRQVLAAMWEAERFLRTARPAEALPAEIRALELLKELQQADRVYVKRMGFEPPVIRIEERRLRGELETIPSARGRALERPDGAENEAAIERVLAVLSRDQGSDLTADDLSRVGRELGLAAQREPDRYLAALAAWQRPGSDQTDTERGDVIRALWSLLPEPSARPERRRGFPGEASESREGAAP